MIRIVIALLGVAAVFASMVVALDLHRPAGLTWMTAGGVFLGTSLIGYPLLYLCCQRRWWQAWHMTLLGTIGGVLCALPFAGVPEKPFFLFLLFMVAGLGLGLLFWLLAIWRNHDLTCPKSFCLPCGTVYRVARNALRR